ncbi:MAG: DUF1697 domain-containing protein [Gemmatimonadaceae bacterium]
MKRVVALLRAVNVGGTGKLAMTDLVAMCETAGFRNVRTYIASGNAIFDTELPELKVQEKLGALLASFAGKRIPVMVRDAAELRDVIADNPFAGAPGNRTIVVFLDAPPPADSINQIKGRINEEVALGKREIYIRYDDGMAHSKLIVPAAKEGTARNMNTVVKLAQLTA